MTIGMAVRTLFAVALVWAIASAPSARGETAQPEPVVVDVVGLAAFPQDVPAEQARREALRDARRHAVMRAHVLLERAAEVQDMELRQERVRERSAGWIQGLEVRQAGPHMEGGRRYYRVEARATLRPLATLQAAEALALHRPDPWAPVVALRLADDREEDAAEGALRRLGDALEGCGVQVAAPSVPRPVLPIEITYSRTTTDAGLSLTIEWEASVNMEQGEPAQARPVLLRGRWSFSGREDPQQGWWQSLGATMAQDVYRLWAAPRWTTVRFERPDAEFAGHLARVMSRPARARVRMEEDHTVVASFPLTGNPLSAVQAMLEQEGIWERVELGEAELTELSFRCLPPSEVD